jgi:hypothetical protein
MKVKIKLPLCLTKHSAMKMYWGSGGKVPLILYSRPYPEVIGQLSVKFIQNYLLFLILNLLAYTYKTVS